MSSLALTSSSAASVQVDKTVVVKLPRRRVLGILPYGVEKHVRIYCAVSILAKLFETLLKGKITFEFTPVRIVHLLTRKPNIFGVVEDILFEDKKGEKEEEKEKEEKKEEKKKEPVVVKEEKGASSTFVKFNSNTIGMYDSQAVEAQAFSHFSYVQSGGKYVVVDLQGTHNESGYRLSDPVIHSPTCEFGMTDRGKLGIADFFKTHSCNDICRLLSLEPLAIYCKHLQYDDHCMQIHERQFESVLPLSLAPESWNSEFH